MAIRRPTASASATRGWLIAWYLGARVAALEQAARDPGDHRVVLGVHRDHRPLAPREAQEVEHLAVVQTQQRVGHEQLERGVAVPDQRRQLFRHDRLARIGHDHVEGVVDHRLLRPLAVVGDHLAHRLAAMLGGERDHRGRAAERRRDRAGVEVVGVPDAHARELLDVAVAVDPARQHQPARRRRSPARARGRSSASATMRPPRTPTSARKRVRRGDNGAVADDQIEIWHGRKASVWIGPPAIAARSPRARPWSTRVGDGADRRQNLRAQPLERAVVDAERARWSTVLIR